MSKRNKKSEVILVKAQQVKRPKSAVIASKGIRNWDDIAEFSSAAIGDLMEDRVSPQLSNATANQLSKLIKAWENKVKYPASVPATSRRLIAADN